MSGSTASTPPIDRANQARDRGEWAAAARLFAEHLATATTDWPAMVQHGHALKEAGEAEAALDAYLAAEALAPEDADLQLQIGHLLKQQGRWEAAAMRYARAATLDPANPIAAIEAAGTERMRPRGAEAAPPRAQGADPRLVFDVTDLLDHFSVRRTPTGIQRVAIGVLSPILEGGLPAGALTGLGTAFAVFDSVPGVWRRLDRAPFAAIVRLSRTGTSITDPDWVAAVDAIKEARKLAPPVRFAQGAVLVNLGNAFGIPDYFRGLRRAQAQSGIRWLPFVHDCVPLEVPEHCLETMLGDYAQWFACFATHAAGFLCNSENTRRDVLRHMAALLPGRRPPASVVRLDGDPRSGLAPSPGALAEIPALRPGERFVLFCSTIESRKDHHLVFSAWLALLRRHGAAKIPRLVCAGRQGWHAQAALDLLAQSPLLRRHVVLTGEVSDEALDLLYDACAFTVYNSHYEGWGLPITESLAHGRVPVVPRHSSLPEAGGSAAVYFTPRSEPDLVAALEPLMLDPEAMAIAEARLAVAPLRPWSALTMDVLAAVRALPEADALPVVAMQPGRRYPTGRNRLTRPDAAMAVTDRLRDGNGWHPAEAWGVWSKQGPVALGLPLAPGFAGQALRLYLDLRAPPRPLDLRIMARAGEEETVAVLPMKPGPDFIAAIDIPPMPDSSVLEIDLDTGPGVRLADLGVDDPRTIGIGIRGVMLCRADDLLSRLGYVEAARFPQAEAEVQPA
ncbi:glycosyltransferase [Humitalea sp. 24SJ18S-53]|uniref:glycosyltransferase n=1 Tax=Humitalea sp. 24SJ18S-53 TaxID=3422307 RepID=UPI003D672B6A